MVATVNPTCRVLALGSLILLLATASLPATDSRARSAADVFRSPGDTTLVSVASDGTKGNDYSGEPSISAYGRYVAFRSYASNLVSGDSNDADDVFVHDRQTGQTSLVSKGLGGSPANSISYDPSISGEGRYVAFASFASNLVPFDTNGTDDVFVHDRQTGQMTRVSFGEGGFGDWSSAWPSISVDGRYVAYQSSAENLVPFDTNDQPDIFVYEMDTGTTTRVSVSSGAVQGNDGSMVPSVSGDGRYVAFVSAASNLVSGDSNGVWDVFVRDQHAGKTTRVSVASDGDQAVCPAHLFQCSNWPVISADGRFVAFESVAGNLVGGDTNNGSDIFVHEVSTKKMTRVSVASDGTQGNGTSYRPAISGDGRYVSFESCDALVVSPPPGLACHVYVHDRETGQTTRASVSSDGTPANYGGSASSISADGRTVAFQSTAWNLVSGDSDLIPDVFVNELSLGAMFLPVVRRL